MLQPRILVGSHRTDQQTTKFNNCVAINRRNCKNTSKMWSQHFTKSTSTNLNGCGINIKRRQTTAKNIKSTAAATAAARRFTSTRALNISSSLHNLATFLILAITLYSTTICMAQLSEHNKDLQPTPSLDSEKAASSLLTSSFVRNDWKGIRTGAKSAAAASQQSLSRITTAAAAATTNSHNQSHNLSHYLHNKQENYQSRQRKDRSSQNHHDRRRIQNNLGVSADKQTDEARYNLATRIMSNGVEVIVAGDKTTLPGGHPNTHLRILTTTEAFKMPLTLAPSTLKDHMLLMLPQTTDDNSNNGAVANIGDPVKSTPVINELQSFYNQNQFVTKTCLTTFTYSTTYVLDGTTKIESREKVITNTATEERNAYNIRPTTASGITLTQTPHLATGVFKTTYTYLNTVLDGEQPVVLTSQHTVANTITAPEDYLSILQPSEPSATLFETNTYFNTMVLTKTLTDNDITKVISTTDVVRQVVITELLPSKSMSVMTSYIAIDSEGNESPADKADILSSPLLSVTDVVKTFYVTYTYFNTYLINGSTIVRTNMSTSSVVATEKLYIYPTTKRLPAPQTTTRNALPIRIEPLDNNIGHDDDYKTIDSNELMNEELRQTVNLYATKTFATTFTYFTTHLEGPSNTDAPAAASSDYDNEHLSTVIDSHTRVVENVVTESIPMKFLPSSAVHKLKLLFFGDDQNQAQIKNEIKYTTLATLIDGQSIEITAVKNAIEPSSKQKDDMQTTNVYSNGASIVNSEENSEEHLIEIDNTKNELENDQDVAGSEHEPLETNPINNKVDSRPTLKNSTKIKTQTQSPVSNLIGSINFNGVLRPMIDAVAGLIKPMINWNNDSIASNAQTIAVHHTPYPLYTPGRPNLPPIPDFIENLTNNQSGDSVPQPPTGIEPAKGHARNPIYIPVNGNNKENYENIENLTPVNFLPPEIVDHSESSNEITYTKSIQNLNLNQKNKIPLLGDGGIPISPGDVITTNSDVIFGRPTGNRPRIPLNRETPVSTVSSGNMSPEQFNTDSHPISSVQSETYIGPPPPLPQKPLSQLQQKPPHLAKATPHFNKIPVFRNKPMFVQNKPAPPPPPQHILSALPPHQLIGNQLQQNHVQLNQIHPNAVHQNQVIANQMHPNQLHPNQVHPKQVHHPNQGHSNQALPNQIIQNQIHLNRIRPHVAHPPHLQNKEPPLPNRSVPQPIRPNLIPLNHVHPTPNIGIPSNTDMHKFVLNNVAGGMNDIIEIQRIPEVFSTDLPPVHIYHAPQEIVSFTAETIEPSKAIAYRPQHEIQTINQLNQLNQFPEVVESATGQPLFVNIQPSQIAKVVIPHGSSSALIFGGVQEMHKSGEYFDDPSPYPNVNDQVISIHSKPSIAVTKNVNAQVQDVNNVQIGSVPAVANQKVNVDSHVLSQDVDMHAPPIIFRNQDTNDIPITSGTILNKDVESHQHLYIPNGYNRSHHDEHPYYDIPDAGNLIRDNNRSPFVVDIQSINLGMSNDEDANISGEVSDDNLPLHSQAPSVNEQLHIDQHKEDDYENEHGEVIQESNSVPQLVSSDQSFVDNLNQILDATKPTTKNLPKDQRIPFTQTEANSLWNKYPSTSELYPVNFTTEGPLVSQTPSSHSHTTSANRMPFGAHQAKVQIPSISPSLVNDMYVPANRTQTLKPIATHGPNYAIRNPNNKQVFYGHQPQSGVEPLSKRPSKFGTPHHITLQNLPVPPHFAGPMYSDAHRPLAPPSQSHHSRRPVSIKQKPFSRYPVHHSKPIPTNYSLHQGEPIKPNWHSSKPFDANHFGPNVPLTTTRHPTTLHDQTPQTSELNAYSTHRPSFIKHNVNNYIQRPDPDSKITHYTDPSTNITHSAQDSNIYDLTRGKPFIFSPQRQNAQEPSSSSSGSSSSNLNIGEEKRPTTSMKHNDTNSNVEVTLSDLFDFKESNNPHNFASITENPNQIMTTDNLPGITNSAFMPFGEKTKLSMPVHPAEQYPKTPATEMQPPPTHATKYKPYIQKHVPAISPSPHHHQNVLIEEVMGLSPPPIPKLSIKKPPAVVSVDNHNGNYGVPHGNLHPVHRPTVGGIFSITAPTHYPETSYVTTHHDAYVESGTETGTIGEPQIVTSTEEQEVAESDPNDNVHIPYKNVMREKSSTKEPIRTTEPTTMNIISDLDDYVRYNVDTKPDVPRLSTLRKPFKPTSNGHMPQSPQFDESSLLQPSQHHIFEEISTPSSRATPATKIKLIKPTATLKAETVKATRHTVHDTKVLTVTTTKTTVRSQGITSTILLTLTRTKTSTIVDTITHTLVKPTRVTHEPTIKPTIFTAPITMQKVSGSSSAIVPNPSFSIYAIGSAHDESEHEHDSSNVSSEDQSFELDDIHNIEHMMISPTPKIPETVTSTKHVVTSSSPSNGTNDSIFVVMSDRRKLGTININADLLNTLTANLHNSTTKHGHDEITSGTQKKAHATMGAIDDVSTDDDNIETTDDDDFFDNLPKRDDEDDNRNDVSHVLLGGILIATPPRSSEVSKNNNGATVAKPPKQSTHTITYDINPADEIDEHIESQGAAIIEETRTSHDKNRVTTQPECQPDCKAVNNEICQITGDLARCVCRPGFARMFLDRPCKPTYTYTLHLAVSQLQSQSLKYEDALRNPSSPKYSHLMQVVHDAIDRMVMQSELRDIYHGVHVAGFNNITRANSTQTGSSKMSAEPFAAPMRGVETEFHLQLSDNSKNEEQIMDVFKKYLQKNNYNLGGTNLFSSQSLIDQLRANDFDECMNAKYHDCSENAYCFNLRGTYTCSCKEGFVDMSENPLYPGRVCSAEMMGCDRCNYHGSCLEQIDDDNEMHEMVCDCFQWYAGEKCQYNLKVLLVGLIALGGVLFALLLICIILTCWKHSRPNGRRRTVVPGIDILPHKTLTVHGSKTGTLQDRRAMIEDTSSETSEDSLQLPYVAKKQQNASSKNAKKVINKPTSAPPKGMAPAPPKGTNNTATMSTNIDPNRSLTVMIPRAKYYSQQTTQAPPESQQQHHQHQDRRSVQTGVATATQGQATMFTTTDSIGSTAEAKLLSYLDASPSTSKNFIKKKTSAHNSKSHLNDDSLNHHYPYHSGETGALISAGFEVSATVVHDSLTTVPNANGLDANSSISTNKKTTDHLVDWLTNVPENELIISEARSYGETLVHPQTKTLIQSPHYRSQNTSVYDKPLSTIMMDDAGTMAERDLGSTFLLPHTHLYKPDRASDISGFDSL
ncbi:uncharacterized protein LOC116340210 isoform X2 [Contarinia nasturtii]|uniref:uncharacterized protein LOC116340210 isoform X2 n=1 Tax=Contarinia nasturtii TaxID=265458 RepID=UPI0012D38E42|nr:uncharacterized protein LOC116340210 isoform X2 [Contarinia nasturtii]